MPGPDRRTNAMPPRKPLEQPTLFLWYNQHYETTPQQLEISLVYTAPNFNVGSVSTLPTYPRSNALCLPLKSITKRAGKLTATGRQSVAGKWPHTGFNSIRQIHQ